MCQPLNFNVNFVFLHRDDGTGNFSPGDPKIASIINRMNNQWANITDPISCEPNFNYPLDSKIRLNIGEHHINNEEAWDYYSQAVDINCTSKLCFCPDNVSPSNSNWPALKSVVEGFNASNPEAYNIFFVENGAHLDYIENAVNNGIPITQKWDNPDNIQIFSGCSVTASDYDSDNLVYTVMANSYTEYMARIHFADLYYPAEAANNSNATIAAWHWDNELWRTINHEMGHSILDMFHQCGCKNLMTGVGCSPSAIPDRQHLDAIQLNDLMGVLSTTNMHNYVSCDPNNGCVFEVFGNEKFNNPIEIFGDLIIKSGVTLEVTSDMFLSEGSVIIVEEGAKLIINGGKLTTRCGKWSGIHVVGGNTDFDVMTKNDAIIENTNDAAISMFSHQGNWLLGGNGNAIVDIDKTTFNNCTRMLAMGAFPPLYNKSQIKNSIQNGGKWGITNWNCLGVIVEGNEFNDQLRECIVTIDGSFQSLYDNDFSSQNIDVLLINTSILESSNIEKNEFLGANTGLHIVGGSVGHMRIFDNEFDNQFFGAFFDNHSAYDILENEFNTDFGVVSAANGGASNSLTSNEFYTSTIGIYPFSNNDGYNFTLNCFETGLIDANIDDKIFDVIKTIGGAAGNCFSHGGTIGSVLDIDGSMDHFTYYENDNLNEDCYRVLSTNTGFSIDVDFESEADCGVGSGDPNKFNPCAIHEDEEDRLRAEQLLLAKIAWVQQHKFLTDEQKNRLIKLYERCLNRNKRKKAEEYLKGGDYASAIALYEGAETSTEDKLVLYGIYMVKQDYSTARAYLNEMASDEDQNISDFKLIQNINLDRLGDQNYEISDSEMSTIITVAEKHHTYSAYAKALLYLYTGELLVTPLPDLSQSIASRSIAKKAKQDGIDVYPNPTTDIVSVLNIDLSDKFEVSIFDINGRLVLSSFVSTDQNDITLTQLTAGLYNIIIYKEDSVIYQDKIIKL